MRLGVGVLLLLWGCSHPAPWKLDTITTGDRSFDCARLIYSRSNSNSPLLFEFRKIEGEVVAFLSLKQFRYQVGDTLSIKAIFISDGEQQEEILPVREGRMRLRISSKTTENLIRSLQEGKKVDILINGYEETLEPFPEGSFKEIFEANK